MKADATTWGNHKACFILADKLNELNDEKLTCRLNKIISTFSNHLRSLRTLEKYKDKTIGLIENYYAIRISDSPNIPESVKSYVLNILHRQSSRYIKGEPSSNDKTRKKINKK